MKKQTKKALAILTLSVFLPNVTLVPIASAAASATADSSAAESQRPDIREQDGVTIVDIAGPNASGLSHNKYNQFDVNAPGLILNNSTGGTTSYLGGGLTISGNDRLNGNPASIILNEVTGTAPSRINGMIEVAGAPASVIVANPNGISGSGFGFINADRATLTTGVPNFDGNGNLQFDVTRGQVEISGNADGEGIVPGYHPSKLDILSRAVQINGEVWASDELNVVTGANRIGYENNDIKEELTGIGAAPTVALDVGALGGMYAGKIRMIGTEDGLGVSVAGEIAAFDSLVMDQQGKIYVEGKVDNGELILGMITAEGDLSIRSSSDIENKGIIASHEDITLEGKNVSNQGVISAGEPEMIENHDEDAEPEYLSAIPSNLTIQAENKISGNGAYLASQHVSLRGEDVSYDNSGIEGVKLFVNGSERDFTKETSDPPAPATPEVPDTSDPMDNKNDDGSTNINPGNLDTPTTPEAKDDGLPIVADTSVTAGKRPIVDKTASGIDLIQITAADGNGVSRNYYTDFNINPDGLILNNATNHTDTHLGGYIAGNHLLGGVSANTILNEVTSSNISHLNGFLEVAGQRANVVIANANGIVANGFGYINAGQAELSTARDIRIVGDGINASRTDILFLRADEIKNENAELWATSLSATADTKLTNTGRIVTTGDLYIAGGELSNEGNGLIYSEGNFITNLDAVNNVENSSIFADGSMDITANHVRNDDSILFAGDKLIIRSQDIKNVRNALAYAVGDIYLLAEGGTVLNQSSNLESEASIYIAAAELTNEKEIFETDWTITTENISYGIPHLQQRNYYNATRRYLRTFYTGTITNESATAKIYAGQDIIIQVGDLNNCYSHIAAGRDLTIHATNVKNHGYQGTIIMEDEGHDYHYWKYKKHKKFHIGCKMVYGVTMIPYTNTQEVDTETTRYGILSAGGTATIVADNIENKTFNAAGDELTFREGSLDPEINRLDPLDVSGKFVLNDKRFTITSDPESQFLYETDPRFKDRFNFLSSDYLLERIKTDPTNVMKRLGDGYYEQRLVMDQILNLTGQRFLDDYTTELDQYIALMNSGVLFADEFNLTLGVALTPEQMAALTSDIVWLVEEEINGEKVLVPYVYLSSLRDGDMTSGGSIIAGNDVEIFARDTLTNVGMIHAENRLEITAVNNIENKAGTIQGGEVDLLAGDTILNSGGLIAGGNVSLAADKIINETTTRTDERPGMSQTTIVEVGAIVASNDLSLYANESITNTGAVLSAGGSMDLTAKEITIESVAQEKRVAVANVEQYDKVHMGSVVVGGDVSMTAQDITIRGSNLGAEDSLTLRAENTINILADKDISNSDITIGKKSGSYYDHQMDNHEYVVGSNLAAGGDITMVSGDEILIQGSNVQSNDGRVLLASDHVAIVNEMERHESLNEHRESTTGLLVSESRRSTDYVDMNLVVGSNVIGNEVVILSNGDIDITASNVIGVEDVNLRAGGDINIGGANNTIDEYHHLEIERSGIMSGGPAGVFIGSERTENTDWSHQESYTGSIVGSLIGDVNMVADGDVNVVGSDVFAGNDIYVEGDNVNIVSGVSESDFHNRFEYEKTGLTISVGGAFIDPLLQAYEYSQVSHNATTDELRYAAAAKAGYELYNTYDNFTNVMDKYKGKGNAAGKPGAIKESIKISVSLGSQSMESSQDTYMTANTGSSFDAGGDVTVIARGDEEAGRDGDITVIGSDIRGENVTLIAKDDINLLASQDTQYTEGENSSSGWSIGAEFNLAGGFGGFNVNVFGGEGENRGDGIYNNESHIIADNTLTMKSGDDMNLIGAQASGNAADIEVGGDLTLISLQDTDNYHERQENWNFGGSGIGGNIVGGRPTISGGYSQQNIDSEYASVNEQTAIIVGDGGLTVNVEGNTHLGGAVISSEADVEDNKISTGTITWNDIENEAEWSAETSGANINIAVGKKPSGPVANRPNPNQGFMPNFSGSEGEDSSTTRPAISPNIEIEVRDEENQEQDIDTLSRDTENANNPLDKIFDKEEILEKQRAAALAGEVGFSLVGKIIQHNNWSQDDPRSILLHGLVGGLVAEINGGNFGEGMTVAAINKLVIAKLGKLTRPRLGPDGKPMLDPENPNQNLTDPLFDGDELRWISAILGGVVSEAAGGNFGQGAGIADSATKNNYLSKRLKELRDSKIGKRDEDGNIVELGECGTNVECIRIWTEYFESVDHSTGAWMTAQGIWDETLSWDVIDAKVDEMYESGQIGAWGGPTFEDAQTRANDALGDKVTPPVAIESPHTLANTEGIFRINADGEKVYTELPEHLAKEFEKINIDGQMLISGAALGEENDFTQVILTINGAQVAIRTDRFGNVYGTEGVDFSLIDWSNLSKYNVVVQTGIILDNDGNRLTESDVMRDYMIGLSGSMSLSGLGSEITYSGPLDPRFSGYSEQAGGVSLNPLPNISEGISSTILLPEYIGEYIRMVVRPPSLNGMTEDQIIRLLKFYQNNPHLKPYH